MQIMPTKEITARNPVTPHTHRAFTLIELLVVVSIIALLVSILLPALGKARDQAKRVVCAAQLHQLGVGVFMYTDDYDDKFPYGNWFNYPFATEKTAVLKAIDTMHVADAIMEYVDDTATMFYCPASDVFKNPTYKECLDKNELVYAPGIGNYNLGYVYLGNQVTSSNGMLMYLTTAERSAYEDQTMYPRDRNSKRCKLFVDSLTDHTLMGTNHEFPNALFTDASVEGSSQADLEIYTRPAGNWYMW